MRPPQASRADNPDFLPSLRLLICREQYSLTDVGLMFGVSRERVRQWCRRHGIEHPETNGTRRGLYAVRIWDDTTHTFRPIQKRLVVAAARRRAADQRRYRYETARAAQIADRWHAAEAAVANLRWELSREPTLGEISDRLIGTTNVAPLISWLGGRTDRAGRESGDYTRIVAELVRRTGLVPRRPGTPGHRPGCHCRGCRGKTPMDTLLIEHRS